MPRTVRGVGPGPPRVALLASLVLLLLNKCGVKAVNIPVHSSPSSVESLVKALENAANRIGKAADEVNGATGGEQDHGKQKSTSTKEASGGASVVVARRSTNRDSGWSNATRNDSTTSSST
ncbi:unnamed protein product [Amoebophrya sp. A25]|nr:unnamed protein product [Amoebophrya sp. A25]|eukprot:GSA25T00017969001.1